MLPLSSADKPLSHAGGFPADHDVPSTVFCSRNRGPSGVETTLARHRWTVVFPLSYDVGSVQDATPATPALTHGRTPTLGSTVTRPPGAADTRTRTVRSGRVTSVVCG